MSTQLQENLAQNIVKNFKRKKPLNKKELVVLSGYDETTSSKHVPAVFEQKGVKDALRKMGLTEELITKALISDINAKEGNRVQELKLGAEILNMTEDKGININFNQTNITIEEKEAINKSLDEI
jgi:hypothetical protein